MSIYVIGDLHLSFSTEKPMDIFGFNWENHAEKIKQNWINKIKDEDTIILPGDFSWATYLEDTYKDFEFLNDLPGRKILSKGNHDYWWTTRTSMRKYIKENHFETIDFLYNNAYCVEGTIIVGTRGWNITDTQNQKIMDREVNRLELSIKDGLQKFGEDKPIYVFLHYPPITKEIRNSGFWNLMKRYEVKKCFYGHLHGASHQEAVEGKIDGIHLRLISSDYLDFNPVELN